MLDDTLSVLPDTIPMLPIASIIDADANRSSAAPRLPLFSVLHVLPVLEMYRKVVERLARAGIVHPASGTATLVLHARDNSLPHC